MSEVTFEPFQKVLVRDYDNQYWRASFFSHEFACDVPRMYHTISGAYRQCIPYNEETAHLLGTGKSPTPPEQGFKWGDHVEVRNFLDNDWQPAIFCSHGPNCFSCVTKGSVCVHDWRYCRHADW